MCDNNAHETFRNESTIGPPSSAGAEFVTAW